MVVRWHFNVNNGPRSPMPYVNCPECGIRSFGLASWSSVHHCPACEAPLRVPRQSAPDDNRRRADWSQGVPVGSATRPDGAPSAP